MNRADRILLAVAVVIAAVAGVVALTDHPGPPPTHPPPTHPPVHSPRPADRRVL